ncbi:MAG: serine/threonine protein phosphatase [Oscillospiraceae bacterium]
MTIFKKDKKATNPVLATLGNKSSHPFSFIDDYTPLSNSQNELYKSLREAIPLIDSAIYKLVRLTGGFKVECEDERYNSILYDFQNSIKCDSGMVSLPMFIDTYFEQLLTFGTAVGEIVIDDDSKAIFLYNAPLSDVSLRRKPTDFKEIEVCTNDGINSVPVKHQDLTLVSTLNAMPGNITGESILKGLPFVSGILLKIYNSIGENWERVGNVRFAVTYKPKDDASGKAFAKERAMQIAKEWGEAMKSSSVKDFIAVGDVDIKVIGADNQILDSQIPVRQMLEQIVAKMSLPPFMLGLSWSTTERMSTQQADVLTTELWHYRRILSPIIEKICATHLRAFGYTGRLNIVWDDITLQDEVDEARARLYDAQARKIEEGGKDE